jgi:4-amino-4-deoxy-L-arabinose transferase-like glycosyltransferase
MKAEGFSVSRWSLVLTAIFALAAALRLWGTNFGLPYTYHPDEGALVMPALNILRTGDYRPLRLDYGSAYIYTLTALYIPYFLYGAWCGYFTTVADLPVYVDYHQIAQYPVPALFLIGRVVTAVLGGLTVLVVYSLGNRLAGRWAGAVAAVLLAVEPLHARHAHFVTTDVPLTFLLMLALGRILDVFERGNWHDYFWAGAWVGLSASTKFPGGVMFSALLIAHLLRSHTWSEVLDKRLVIGIAATAGGFLVGTPYALDLPYFLNWMAVNLSFYGKTASALVEGPTWLYYAKNLFLGETGPIVLVGVLGLARFVRQEWRRGVVVTAFPAIYATSIVLQTSRYSRHLIPLIPFLVLGAGMFLVTAAEWLARRLPTTVTPPRLPFVLAGLVALIAIVPLGVTIKTSALLAGQDIRTLALEWYNANIPPQAKVAADWTGPSFTTGRHNVWRTWDLAEHNADWYVEQQFAYLVISEPRVFDPNRTAQLEASYREIMSRFTLVKVFEGALLGIDGRHIWIYSVTR